MNTRMTTMNDYLGLRFSIGEGYQTMNNELLHLLKLNETRFSGIAYFQHPPT